MDVLVIVVISVAVFGLIIAVGTHLLSSGAARSTGVHHAMSNFIDVFDPARSRADEDLRHQLHAGSVIPSPDDDEPPVVVDLDTGTARITRRPTTGNGRASGPAHGEGAEKEPGKPS